MDEKIYIYGDGKDMKIYVRWMVEGEKQFWPPRESNPGVLTMQSKDTDALPLDKSYSVEMLR